MNSTVAPVSKPLFDLVKLCVSPLLLLYCFHDLSYIPALKHYYKRCYLKMRLHLGFYAEAEPKIYTDSFISVIYFVEEQNSQTLWLFFTEQVLRESLQFFASDIKTIWWFICSLFWTKRTFSEKHILSLLAPPLFNRRSKKGRSLDFFKL